MEQDIHEKIVELAKRWAARYYQLHEAPFVPVGLDVPRENKSVLMGYVRMTTSRLNLTDEEIDEGWPIFRDVVAEETKRLDDEYTRTGIWPLTS